MDWAPFAMIKQCDSCYLIIILVLFKILFNLYVSLVYGVQKPKFLFKMLIDLATAQLKKSSDYPYPLVCEQVKHKF